MKSVISNSHETMSKKYTFYDRRASDYTRCWQIIPVSGHHWLL